MVATVQGIRKWSIGIDKDGYREYQAVLLVKCSAVTDGPQSIISASGMPTIGAAWAWGGDYDPWALRWPTLRARPVVEGEIGVWWEADLLYTNKPLNRCQDTTIDDPLLEPPKISGSFVNYTEEKTGNRDGDRFLTSSHELYRGPIVEFDSGRPTVEISFNSATLDLATISQLLHNVNDAVLWGCAARTVKFSRFSWERKILGSCGYYYTQNLGFDINFDTFDRVALDEGTKVLDTDIAGANKNNPSHFKANQDGDGNIVRVLLDGNGKALNSTAAPVTRDIVYYPEENLLSLGIPAVF